MEETQRIRELSKLLKEMNRLLQGILQAQFGIEHNKERWLDAIQTIELGFSKAVNYIGETKGMIKPGPGLLTDEDIEKILSD
ncbi:hypothetical protein MUP05_01450 [Candidatus Bathyarchaeota archaeon]|nr:hypothetical protein [Candidatus Bathyarchaeota archaeon]